MSSWIQFKTLLFPVQLVTRTVYNSLFCSMFQAEQWKRERRGFFFFFLTLKLIPRFYHLVKTNLCRVSKNTQQPSVSQQHIASPSPNQMAPSHHLPKKTGKTEKKEGANVSISPSLHWQPSDRKWKSQNFNKQNQLCLFRKSSGIVETLSREVLELNSPQERSACWLLFVVLPAFCYQSAALTHRGGRAPHSALEADGKQGGSVTRSRG